MFSLILSMIGTAKKKKNSWDAVDQSQRQATLDGDTKLKRFYLSCTTLY